jgi:hypothetical protein
MGMTGVATMPVMIVGSTTESTITGFGPGFVIAPFWADASRTPASAIIKNNANGMKNRSTRNIESSSSIVVSE